MFISIDSALRRVDKKIILALVLLVNAIVAWFDYRTGPFIYFELCYIIPLFLTAWYAGGQLAILVSFISAGVRSYVLLAGFFPPWLFLYNFFEESALFLFITYFIVLIRRQLDGLTAQSQADDLTEANNRRYFYQAGSAEIARSYRYKHPLTLAFIDLDNFKGVNDSQGHEVGDQLLIKIVGVIKSDLREGDLLGRLGGDEFAVLLLQTDAKQAKVIIERMRKNVLAAIQPFRSEVTASIGVATYTAEKPISIDQLTLAADRAMYSVKRTTKDAVRFCQMKDGST